MKKVTAIFMTVFLILGLVAPAYCGGPREKLGRGISNIFTCPLEIPNRIKKVYGDLGFLEASTYGLVQGVVMTGFRLGAGLVELATFPFPFPGNYEPILDDPEYFITIKNKKEVSGR